MMDYLYDIINQIKDPETMTNGTRLIIDGALAVSAFISYGIYNFIKEGNIDVTEVIKYSNNTLGSKERSELAQKIADNLEKLV